MANTTARAWLQRIHALELDHPVRIMNVCGGHERSISLAGLRTALPSTVDLIPGPGCPVCVCPEESIHQAIQIALHEPVILAAFGDMLRVPVNVSKGEVRSLEEARAAGGDIRPVASPMDVAALAREAPDRPVVFLAAGFETTLAPIAALLAQGAPENLRLLMAGRLTWPAVSMLLDRGEPGFDGLIAPGHVATIMGADEWRFVPESHGLPAAVAGFTPESLLAAIYSVLRQYQTGSPFLDNCYPELVTAEGNRGAQRTLDSVLRVEDAAWRGIGVIPGSGFGLAADYAAWDAERDYADYRDLARKRAGAMPPGCDCARVVLGQIRPTECTLYGRACTPRTPIGPCMVSDEGACRIWWSAGVREPEAAA